MSTAREGGGTRTQPRLKYLSPTLSVNLPQACADYPNLPDSYVGLFHEINSKTYFFFLKPCTNQLISQLPGSARP